MIITGLKSLIPSNFELFSRLILPGHPSRTQLELKFWSIQSTYCKTTQIILFTNDGFAEFTADSEKYSFFCPTKNILVFLCALFQGLGMCKVLYDRLGLSNTEVS